MSQNKVPTKFPFRCRALYSWGGEKETDLGFIEGDEIECLNLGDGQWWMGRLQRDKRYVGSFPSNFVAILEDFPKPLSRPVESASNSQPSLEKERARSTKPFHPGVWKSQSLSRHDGSPERPRPLSQGSHQSPSPPPFTMPVETSGEGSNASEDGHNAAIPPGRLTGSTPQQGNTSIEDDSFHQTTPSPSVHGMSDGSPKGTPSVALSTTMETYVERMERRLRQMQQQREPEVDEASPPSKRRFAFELRSTFGRSTIDSKYTATNSSVRSGYTGSSAASSAGMSTASWSTGKSSNPSSVFSAAASGFSRRSIDTNHTTSDRSFLDPVLSAGNAGNATRVPTSLKKEGFFKNLLNDAREKSLTSGSTMGSSYKQLNEPSDYLSTLRDMVRSNTPGPIEQSGRADECRMLGLPTIRPIEELYRSGRGGMTADGTIVRTSVRRHDMDLDSISRLTREIDEFPSGIGDAGVGDFAIRYLCRSGDTELQKLTVIFLWCATELVRRPDGAHSGGTGEQARIDTTRVINRRWGTSREIAAVVVEMCLAVGIPAHMVRGQLKNSAENMLMCPEVENWWSAVLVDNEWRFLDVALAGTSLPYEASTHVNPWYFLTPPTEFCWTHIPRAPLLQHLVPPAADDVLRFLPTPRPAFFSLGLSFHDFDTSLTHIQGLELCTISINVPPEIEIVAEVSVTAREFYSNDNAASRGDFEKMRALSQPRWYRTSSNLLQKRFIVKALLPGPSKAGVLRIHGGKVGLRHSSNEIVHPLVASIPISHRGDNQLYGFVKRHPTPHATRMDLYVVSPQCLWLWFGRTYMFRVRQHPASITADDESTKRTGKPAKMALQSPSGKVIRLFETPSTKLTVPEDSKTQIVHVLGNELEAFVKVTETGRWRGLVLADRSARWCVFAEWECTARMSDRTWETSNFDRAKVVVSKSLSIPPVNDKASTKLVWALAAKSMDLGSTMTRQENDSQPTLASKRTTDAKDSIGLDAEHMSSRAPNPQIDVNTEVEKGTTDSESDNGSVLHHENETAAAQLPWTENPQEQGGDSDSETVSQWPEPLLDSLKLVDDIIGDVSMIEQERHLNPEQEEYLNPWSPAAFDQLSRRGPEPNRQPIPPLEFVPERNNTAETQDKRQLWTQNSARFQDSLPQLETYVQRMESQLRRRTEGQESSLAESVDSDPPKPPPHLSLVISRPGSSVGSKQISTGKQPAANEVYGQSPLEHASDDALEGMSDTAMRNVPSPSLLNHPEDGQLVQYMQPSEPLEGSIGEIFDMRSSAASERVAESDSDENTITEPHEGPATTAVHNSMLDSIMGGFRRVEAMLRSSMQVLRRRPSVRISWTCGCGSPMYADIVELKAGAALRLQEALRGASTRCQNQHQLTDQAAGATSSGNSGINAATAPPSSSSTASNNTTTALSTPSALNTAPNPGIATSSNPPATTPSGPNTSSQERRFLLLCIATAVNSELSQIELTSITNDEYMFDLIRGEISASRLQKSSSSSSSPRSNMGVLQVVDSFSKISSGCSMLSKWLRPPDMTMIAGLDFVRFRLVPVREKTQPWNFTSPALPPEQEVRQQRYLYAPCPHDDYEITSLDHVMMHSLLTPGPHLDRFWLDQFPKKLKVPLSYRYGSGTSDAPANVAWGLRLRYGVNWTAMLWVLVVVVALSGVAAIVYSVVLGDPGSAFQIAGYVLTAVALLMGYLQLRYASPG